MAVFKQLLSTNVTQLRINFINRNKNH